MMYAQLIDPLIALNVTTLRKQACQVLQSWNEVACQPITHPVDSAVGEKQGLA